jgi:hypothetical protein
MARGKAVKSKTNPTARQDEPDSRQGDEPVSLRPLKPEQALAGLLRVRPTEPPKRGKKRESGDKR